MSRSVRLLGQSDVAAARCICALDPVDSVMAAARVDIAATHGLAKAGGELWGWPGTGQLQAICWVGANLVPVVPKQLPDPARIAAAGAFGDFARHRRRTSGSIAGERDAVLALWRKLEPFWPRAREVRTNQPSMIMGCDPQIPIDPLVRIAQPMELGVLLPACIAMFSEEVGFSPVAAGDGDFRARLRELITAGQSYLRTSALTAPYWRSVPLHQQIEFKAEIGVVAGGVAQVQGVWIPPRLRGQGLSAPAMAAVVLDARHRLAPIISLYANSHNERALRCYRRVGFEQVGTFATVLF